MLLVSALAAFQICAPPWPWEKRSGLRDAQFRSCTVTLMFHVVLLVLSYPSICPSSSPSSDPSSYSSSYPSSYPSRYSPSYPSIYPSSYSSSSLSSYPSSCSFRYQNRYPFRKNLRSQNGCPFGISNSFRSQKNGSPDETTLRSHEFTFFRCISSFIFYVLWFYLPSFFLSDFLDSSLQVVREPTGCVKA